MLRSAGYKILLIEDDDDWTEIIRLWLETGGYPEVRCAETAAQALRILQDFLPDCILLDLQLNDADGSELCRRLRAEERTAKVPIIMVTSHLEHRLSCLSRGADYFVAKSNKGAELLATLNAVFRRRDLDSDIGRKGDLAFLPQRHEIYLAGELAATLTPKAYELFLTLVKRSPSPVSREELQRLIEVKEEPELSRGLDILMNRMRKALPPALQERIRAVRGFGYMYIDPA